MWVDDIPLLNAFKVPPDFGPSAEGICVWEEGTGLEVLYYPIASWNTQNNSKFRVRLLFDRKIALNYFYVIKTFNKIYNSKTDCEV